MRLFPTVSTFFAALLLSFGFATAGQANVVAKIDLSDQKMSVYINGNLEYSWKVSTGKSGYRTPRGTYRPGTMTTMHYSRKYDLTPMPYSIFFKGGYAIHGTSAIQRLGRPASHGCVRLHPDNAKKLFNIVKRHGKKSTKIVVHN